MTTLNTQDFWALSPAQDLNNDIKNLPVATLTHLKSCDEGGIDNDGVETKGFRAVVVNNELVACPTKSYTLVQHEKAFRPIIEGMTQAGVKDFRYSLYNDDRQAHMNIYVDTAEEKGDMKGIQVGFRVTNSFDRSTSIRYGFSTHSRTKRFELVGYRLACKNGMKIEVPIEEAEFVTVEERSKLKKLLAMNRRIAHTGDVDKKLEEMQYITEAVSILVKPMERMVAAAKEIKLEDIKVVEKLIEKHISRRMIDRIRGRYITDQDFSLWGLYNAITYEASHSDLHYTTSMGLIERSGRLLTDMLVAQTP